VDAREFFGLQPTEDPRRWRLPVVQRLASGMGTLFGGAGLGACVEVLERTTGRQTVWATAQYLSYVRPPSVVDIEITEAVRGHQVSQARATVRLEGEEILTVNAALGTRPFDLSGSWATRPEVPPPEDCPPRPILPRMEGSIASAVDVRVAAGTVSVDDLPGEPSTSGNSALWARFPDLEVSAAALAIVGDYVPWGIRQALGQPSGGNSLDNTLRVAHRVPTEWVLADVRVHAVANGFGHGLVHLWAEDGTLLGTASQSAIVRRPIEETVKS
jgi:acyl-CoA thioesterase II